MTLSAGPTGDEQLQRGHAWETEKGSPTMELAERLRQLREQSGMTAEALSRRAGLPWSYVGRIEAGEIRDPRISTCQKLAAALGVSVGELLGEEPPRRRARGRQP